uniref:Predicted protein n=1 Tax=Hordeum vulgare subsp. vulgare TaxID=112509 RepID=F2EGV8_HORVV|nr:predicted protein [Hordeum vulgare subsp. vulgare]
MNVVDAVHEGSTTSLKTSQAVVHDDGEADDAGISLKTSQAVVHDDGEADDAGSRARRRRGRRHR